MSAYDTVSDKAAKLIGQIGHTVKGIVPDGLPSRALRLVETGAVIGAVKTGTRYAGKFARRNPALLVAAAAGAGLLWYAASRRARQAQNGPIDSTSKRVDAQRRDDQLEDDGDSTADASTTAHPRRRARPANRRRAVH